MPTSNGEADVYLYAINIPDEPFKVFEGVESEYYTKKKFLERNDTSNGAVHLLKQVEL